MYARGVIGVCLGVVAASCVLPGVARARVTGPADLGLLSSGLPAKAAALREWPTSERRASKAVHPELRLETWRARHGSITWIETIIDPQWLPPNPEEYLPAKLVLLENAYGDLDTSHVEWMTNGYLVRVTQTATVFYLALTPLPDTTAADDPAAMRRMARDLASRVITGIPEVMSIGSDEANVAPGGTRSVLLRVSFDEATVKQFADGIVGKPARPNLRDQLDRRRLDYWWGAMQWWTDGRTLGLFAPKANGGPWRANWVSKLDENWFLPQPSGLRPMQPRVAATGVDGALPKLVAALRTWPAAEQLENDVLPRSYSIEAVESARVGPVWILKVVDPEWLPQEPREILDSRFVVMRNTWDNYSYLPGYVEWKAQGYQVQVGQTDAVFCIRLTPLEGRIAEGDADALRAAARQLVSELIRDTDEGCGPDLAPGGVKAALLRYSFDNPTVREFDDGIVAIPKPPDVKTEVGYSQFKYWWRHVGWWTDGKVLGLFPIKATPDTWEPRFGSMLLEEWYGQ